MAAYQRQTGNPNGGKHKLAIPSHRARPGAKCGVCVVTRADGTQYEYVPPAKTRKPRKTVVVAKVAKPMTKRERLARGAIYGDSWQRGV
jgi:hypothetical protein